MTDKIPRPFNPVPRRRRIFIWLFAVAMTGTTIGLVVGLAIIISGWTE